MDAGARAPPPRLVHERPMRRVHQPDDAVVHIAGQIGGEVRRAKSLAELRQLRHLAAASSSCAGARARHPAYRPTRSHRAPRRDTRPHRSCRIERVLAGERRNLAALAAAPAQRPSRGTCRSRARRRTSRRRAECRGAGNCRAWQRWLPSCLRPSTSGMPSSIAVVSFAAQPIAAQCRVPVVVNQRSRDECGRRRCCCRGGRDLVEVVRHELRLLQAAPRRTIRAAQDATIALDGASALSDEPAPRRVAACDPDRSRGCCSTAASRSSSRRCWTTPTPCTPRSRARWCCATTGSRSTPTASAIWKGAVALLEHGGELPASSARMTGPRGFRSRSTCWRCLLVVFTLGRAASRNAMAGFYAAHGPRDQPRLFIFTRILIPDAMSASGSRSRCSSFWRIAQNVQPTRSETAR